MKGRNIRTVMSILEEDDLQDHFGICLECVEKVDETTSHKGHPVINFHKEDLVHVLFKNDVMILLKEFLDEEEKE